MLDALRQDASHALRRLRQAPRDPLTLGGVALLLLATTLLAGYVPARRATRVDPVTALRAE